MGKIRLFIEDREIELTEDIQFSITKLFADLTNPTTIINSWSKSISIPFTKANHRVFGDLYRQDRIIVDRQNLANTLQHAVQYLSENSVDWKTNSLEYFSNAPYFSLSGLKTELVEKNATGSILNKTTIQTYNKEGYYEKTYTYTKTEGNTYSLLFSLISSPYLPGFLYELGDITTFSYTLDIKELSVSDKKISFGNIYIIEGELPENENSHLIGLYFNPLKKLNFRLLNGDNVIMTGYAKTLSATQNNGTGSYNITLNGELGKIFKELKEIKIQTGTNSESVYDWNTDDYIKFNMNKDIVKSSWTKSINRDEPLDLHKKGEAEYDLTDYIGFSPSNARDEGFDYTMFQYDGDNTKTFEDELANHKIINPDGSESTFESETGMTAKDAISKGLLPREIGEFRSYLQTPFIMWNKYFLMFCKKAEELTGYKCILDKTWFNNDNPYWSYLAMMLSRVNIKDVLIYSNEYNMAISPEHINWEQNPGYGPRWYNWFSWSKQGTKYVINQNARTYTTSANVYPESGQEQTNMATFGTNGYFTIPENGKVTIKSSLDISYKVEYTDDRDPATPNPKLNSDSTFGTFAGANLTVRQEQHVHGGGNVIDLWNSVWLNHRDKWPAELAAAETGTSPKGYFEVKLDILNSNGGIVKSETKYYFTKDSRYNNPDIPEGFETNGYLLPEENCYTELSLLDVGNSQLSASQKYIFKIPVYFNNVIRDTDLLDDKQFKIRISARLVPRWAGWRYGYDDFDPSRNTVGYLMTVIGDDTLYRNNKDTTKYRYNFLNNAGSDYGPATKHRMPLDSEQDYLRQNDRAYFEIENGQTSVLFDIATGERRTGSTIRLTDMWQNEQNPFMLILNYCKMFRIGVFADEFNKTLTFSPLSTYFGSYTIEDWTDKIDKSNDYTILPVSFDSHSVLFNYEDDKTLLGKAYKEAYGFNFGEKNLITQYEFDNNTTKLFDKIPTSISFSDTILSWSDLYDDLKYNWHTLSDIYPYNLSDDKKYNSMFGQYFFYKARGTFEDTGRTVYLSDDTSYLMLAGKYIYTQSSDTTKITSISTYPLLDLYDHGINGITDYCLFNVPNKDYTASYTGRNNKNGIYDNLWEAYINELYNKNTKKVTCYVKLSPVEYSNFEFNHFVTIDGTLFLVNKIFDYNMTNNVTKVELITINNIDAYIYNDFIKNTNSFEFTTTDYETAAYLPATAFVYRRTFLCEKEAYNNCMFLTDEEVTQAKTIKFEANNLFTDEEMGLNIEIRNDNNIYIQGYKAVTVGEDEELSKTYYIMNRGRYITAITVIRS